MQLHYLDAVDLTQLTLAEALAGEVDGVYCPDLEWRRYRRAAPDFIDNPSGRAGFCGLGEVEIRYPPAFLASARDACLVGYRSVVTKDRIVFNDDAVGADAVGEYLARLGKSSDPLLNEDTGFSLTNDQRELAIGPAAENVIDIPDIVVSLCSQEPSNYGSFIFRVLPKLHDIRNLGLLGNSRFIAYPTSSTSRECLELLGLPSERVIPHNTRQRYQCKHILVPSLRNNQAYLDAESLKIIGYLRQAYGCKQVSGKKLYISRHRYAEDTLSPRRLLNERELIDRLSGRGFEIVSPEKLTMREQIEAFSSAELIVGPAGSAMFNCVFCWPGTKIIDIESERWWLHAHMSLFSSCDLRYGLFIGEPDPEDHSVAHRRWTVNVDALIERIENLDPESRSRKTVVPDDQPLAHTRSIGDDHTGADFHTVLQSVHRILRPRSYLEIGTCTGASLALAHCKSIAIDPMFQLDQDVISLKPACFLFRMGSDEFFRDHNPVALLGCEIDLAFLDGMHHHEFLLRDFMNTERSCRRNSVIFLHDCIPTDQHIARRRGDDHSLASTSSHPNWWAGDLWKAIKLLKQYRPDLSISAFNAPPTGLIAITGLNPTSDIIKNRYFEMLESARGWVLDEDALISYRKSLNIGDTSALMNLEQLAGRFWL